MNIYSPEFVPHVHISQMQQQMYHMHMAKTTLTGMMAPHDPYYNAYGMMPYPKYFQSTMPSAGCEYGYPQQQSIMRHNREPVVASSALTRAMYQRQTNFVSKAENLLRLSFYRASFESMHATKDDTLQRDSSKGSHLPQRKDDRITKPTDGSLAVKCQKHKSAKHIQRQKNHKLSHYVEGDQKKTGAAVSSVFNNLLGTRLNGIRNMEYASNGEYFASVTEESIIKSHNPVHRNSSASDAASNSDDVNSVSSREDLSDNYEFVKVNKKTARVRNNRKQRRQNLQQQQEQQHQQQQQQQVQHQKKQSKSGTSKSAGVQQKSESSSFTSINRKESITATVQQQQQSLKTAKDHILAVSKVSSSSSGTSSPSTSEANSASSSPTASPKAKRIGKIRQMIESPFSIVDVLSEHEIASYMTRYIIDNRKLRGFGYPVESATYEGCIEIYKCIPRFFKQRICHVRRHHNRVADELNTYSPVTRKHSSGDSGKGSETSSSPSYNGSPADSDYSEEEIAAEYMNSEILEKRCDRCKKFFKVTTTGEYVTNEPCHYHWGKQEVGEYIDENGDLMTITYFSCCKRLSSDPCSQNHVHVWSEISLGLNGPYTDFVFTTSKHGEKSNEDSKGNRRKIFALDCEMSYTGLGMEVTKITVLGYNGKPVYESIVQTRSKVVDYNTRFSGVSEKDFAPGNNVRTFEIVQNDLLNLIDADDIIIGHAVENDLRYLRIVHKCIVDTSIVFPHPNGFPFKRGLKSVVADELGRDIQVGHDGHCSYEDSQACLELMLLKVRADWKAKSTKKAKSDSGSLTCEQSVYGHHYVSVQQSV